MSGNCPVNCELQKDCKNSLRWQCVRCGREIITRRERDEISGHLICKKPGMGDYVSNRLAAFGVKKKSGCGCSKRQKDLNQAGEKVRKYFKKLFKRD